MLPTKTIDLDQLPSGATIEVPRSQINSAVVDVEQQSDAGLTWGGMMQQLIKGGLMLLGITGASAFLYGLGKLTMSLWSNDLGGETEEDNLLPNQLIPATAANNVAETLQPPVLIINQLNISRDETLMITSENLLAIDPVIKNSSLIFIVSSLAYGKFYKSGSTVTQFTQADVTSGLISFQHVIDYSFQAPLYKVQVYNGISMSSLSYPEITFCNQGVKPITNTLTVSNPSKNSYDPDITSLADGKFVVVYRVSTNNYDIFAQLLNADGSKYGNELAINVFTANEQCCPKTAGLANGKFVITWQSYQQDGFGWGIYSQIFNPDGSKYNYLGETRINTLTFNNAPATAVVGLLDGKFVIIWGGYAQDVAIYGIWGQLFNADGSMNGGNLQINTSPLSSLSALSVPVTSFSDGKFAVAWNYNSGSGKIYIQILNPDGTKEGAEIIFTNIYYPEYPTETTLNDNKFVVAWYGRSLEGKIMNEGGSLYGKNISIGGESPITASFKTGRFLLADAHYNYGFLFNHDGSQYYSRFQLDNDRITISQRNNTIMSTWGYSGTIYTRLFLERDTPNYPPTIAGNQVTIARNQRVPVTNYYQHYVFYLNSIDVDDTPENLVYLAYDVQHGQFCLARDPATQVTTFTQRDINDGEIVFIHDGNIFAPSAFLWVNDMMLNAVSSNTKVKFFNTTEPPILSSSSSSISTSRPSSLVSLSSSSSPFSSNSSLDISSSKVISSSSSSSDNSRQKSSVEVSSPSSLTNSVVSFSPSSGSTASNSLSSGIANSSIDISSSQVVSASSSSRISVIESSSSEPKSSAETSSSSSTKIFSSSLLSSSSSPPESISSQVSSSHQITPSGSASSSLIESSSSLNDTDKNNRELIIAGAVVGGVLLSTCVIAGVGFWCHKPKPRPEPGLKNPEICFSTNVIRYKDLKFERLIGNGGGGSVYKGVWISTRTEVAIKQLGPTFSSGKREQLAKYEREAEIMMQLRHPNIVQIFGVCRDTAYCIVMEYMPLGSLDKLLHSNTNLPWRPTRWQILKDCVNGLFYLHNQDIMHRDIKSANVLLGAGLRAKLTDFGVARIISPKCRYTIDCGTTAWVAPELFTDNGIYDSSVDIYSFGVFMWELVSREKPFDGLSIFAVYRKVVNGERPEIPKECSPKMKTLIERCWNQRRELRPSIWEVGAEIEAISEAENMGVIN